MKREAMAALRGAAAAMILVAAGNCLAAEPGNFQQTLAGATIDAPLGAQIPTGLYAVLDTFLTPAAAGKGQNGPNAAAGLPGTTVEVQLYAPTLLWSTGYKVAGATISMVLVQPFYSLDAYNSSGASVAGNGSGSPHGGAFVFDVTHNSLITPVIASWYLGEGNFASAGLTLIPPDGSRYNGSPNPDYWSYEPRFAYAYLGKEWHLTANLKYDINAASAGHTGSYQILAHAPPFNAIGATVASIGNGYKTGQQAFLDLAATYKYDNWEFGPVASMKWQTTADNPGGGYSCGQIAAIVTSSFGCGRATNHSIGGLVGYRLGPVNLQLWATDSVHTQDDFSGLGVYTRLTVKFR